MKYKILRDITDSRIKFSKDENLFKNISKKLARFVFLENAKIFMNMLDLTKIYW